MFDARDPPYCLTLVLCRNLSDQATRPDSGVGCDPREGPVFRGATFLLGLGLGLLWLERRVPLRASREPKKRRLGRNLVMSGLNALTVSTLEMPIINWLSRQVELRRWGLAQRLFLPRWARDLLAVTLLDYTLFLWHVLVHRNRWLWRLHQVHHADLDLDASTALRFHFVEMVVSVPWRAAQVVVIGVSPRALSIWQRLLMASILFHHSNVCLPARFEKALSWLVMTPRLHGIHHAREPALRDTNWSSGLTLWDILHGTRKTDVPQESIRIGIEGFTQPEQVRLGRMLLLPLARDSESQSETEPPVRLKQR